MLHGFEGKWIWNRPRDEKFLLLLLVLLRSLNPEKYNSRVAETLAQSYLMQDDGDHLMLEALQKGFFHIIEPDSR